MEAIDAIERTVTTIQSSQENIHTALTTMVQVIEACKIAIDDTKIIMSEVRTMQNRISASKINCSRCC